MSHGKARHLTKRETADCDSGLPPVVTITPSGRALFEGTQCQYSDVVRPDDLVLANFDAKDVHTGGGLYLLEAVEHGRVVWRGCRYLERRPEGVAINQDGHRDWHLLGSLEAAGYRVAGLVEKVYRPT